MAKLTKIIGTITVIIVVVYSTVIGNNVDQKIPYEENGEINICW